eukprot:5673199-Pyramimonas_sp.AAC.1
MMMMMMMMMMMIAMIMRMVIPGARHRTDSGNHNDARGYATCQQVLRNGLTLEISMLEAIQLASRRLAQCCFDRYRSSQLCNLPAGARRNADSRDPAARA